MLTVEYRTQSQQKVISNKVVQSLAQLSTSLVIIFSDLSYLSSVLTLTHNKSWLMCWQTISELLHVTVLHLLLQHHHLLLPVHLGNTDTHFLVNIYNNKSDWLACCPDKRVTPPPYPHLHDNC